MSIAQFDVVAKKFFLGPKKIFGAIGLVFSCASLAIVETRWNGGDASFLFQVGKIALDRSEQNL